MNDLCLEEANHRLGECIVIRTADGADTGFQSSISQAFCVFDRQVLAAAITVMDQAICRPPFIKHLLQSIQGKLGLLRFRCPPANDLVGKGIDNECHIDKTLPGRDIGKIVVHWA